MPPVSNFTEIRPMEAALIHVDRRAHGRTDGHDVALREPANAPKILSVISPYWSTEESKTFPIQSMTQNHVTSVLGCDLDLPTLLNSVTHFPKCDQILSELD